LAIIFYRIWFFIDKPKKVIINFFYHGEEYLKNNPETVDDFVDAFSRGYQSSIQNNDASMESLISAFPEVNVELETKGIKLLSPLWKESFDSDGIDSWIKFGDWMKSKELIDRNLDVEKSLIK